MVERAMVFTHPRFAWSRWLAFPGRGTPAELHGALLATLFGTLPVYFAALANTVVMAGAVALHHREIHFTIWFAGELAICTARLVILLLSLRGAAAGRTTPTDLYIGVTLLWAVSLGCGAFLAILHGDWRSTAIVCLSAAAMAGGSCLRNYGAPRFAVAQMLLNLGPAALAAALSGEPVLLVILLQVPFFLFSMAVGAYRLNRMLVRTMEAELDSHRRAQHDPLTDLYNRAGLERGHALRPDDALFYIDLDGFKAVNDRHGHGVGDDLLREAAARLRATVGAAALAARIGGDEFVILAPVGDADAAIALGEAMAAALSRPYTLADTRIPSGASVGIAMPQAGMTLATMMALADRSLYHVKALGGGARLHRAGAATALARAN